MGISDNALWRVIDHYVGDAVEKMDCSSVVQVGFMRRHLVRDTIISVVFFDLDARRLIFATEGRDNTVVNDFAHFLHAHGGRAEAIQPEKRS